MSDRKQHWDHIYQTRPLEAVSWYEPTPEISLRFIGQLNLSPKAKIIDIGGGDSLLVDHLMDLGYEDLTVLDISAAAIERAKKRLGEKAIKVKWIVADITRFRPTEQYDLWHDRAAFHFLTDEPDISKYLEAAVVALKPTGVLVIGTFSEQGPQKCSGLMVKQYSEQTMTQRLKEYFEKIRCVGVDHRTPAGAVQDFVFCSFRRISGR
ncbi:MAG TPA: class I SAM-dependent methyltransferase [Puia sp.]|nr:class I SAM-dependent methyltransferase [Puia sp.]